MVKTLSDVDISFNKSVPNSNVVGSKHNTKHKKIYSDRSNDCDRFRSRKPPSNPRAVDIHKRLQKICEKNLKQIQETNLEFQKLLTEKKTNQLAVTQPAAGRRSVPKYPSRKHNSNFNHTPKLQSKSKFALNKKQSGSNFSLVVNLSKRKVQYPYKPEHQSLKDEFPQKFITEDNSKERHLTVPLDAKTEATQKYHIYPFIMENWKSEPSRSPSYEKTNPGEICFCSQPPTQKKDTVSLNKSQQNEQRPGCDDGYTDIYRRMSVPTADAYILAGLETVIDMCSTAEIKSTKSSTSETSSNQAIIKWVKKEYSTLDQDSCPNICETSSYNIQQRKETLHEIEKLVRKKSQLDKEAQIIKKKKVSLTSSTSSTRNLIESSNIEETEESDDGGAKVKTSLSKLPSPSVSLKSRNCLCCPLKPSHVDKWQCTETMILQTCQGTQHPSSASTESVYNESDQASDYENLSEKSTKTTEITECGCEECSKSNKTCKTDTSANCSHSSTAFDESSNENESIQCSNKSIQACTLPPMSTKSVQTCTQIQPIPFQGIINQTCTCSDNIRMLTEPLTQKQMVSPNRSNQFVELLEPSIQPTIICACKSSQSLNHLEMVCTSSEQTSSSSTTSKSTSNRFIPISESSLKSSRMSSCVGEDGSSILNSKINFNLRTKEFKATASLLKTENLSQKNTGEEYNKIPLSATLPCVCKQSISSQTYEAKLTNVPSDKTPVNEKQDNVNTGKDIPGDIENIQKISASKLLKSPKISGTLTTVTEESSSKSTVCKICRAKSTSGKLPTECASEASCNRSKLSQCPSGRVAVRKRRPLRSERSSHQQIDFKKDTEESSSKSTVCKICRAKSTPRKLPAECASEASCNRSKLSQCPSGRVAVRKRRPLRSERSSHQQIDFKKEFSEKDQSVGDGFTQTTSPKVRYAMVRITKFEQYSTFEILNTAVRKPKCFPATTETIFVVKNKSK